MITTFQWVQLVLGSGIGIPIISVIVKKIKVQDKKIEAMCYGTQALLRDRLITSYNKYKYKGYAPIYAKENFENMWKQYHNLGANGVMDEIHEKFKNLPTQKEEHHEEMD